MSDQETAIAPAPPHVDDLTVPWKATSPEAVSIDEVRERHGDTFTADDGGDQYLFLLSPAGVRSVFGLAGHEATQDLADDGLLFRRLPDDVLSGRRTVVTDLLSTESVEALLPALDQAVTAELDDLSDIEIVDVFEMARRLGHRFAITCWFGIDGDRGPEFEQMVDDLDLLDGSDAFLPQEGRAEGDDDLHVAAALDRIETMVAAALDSDAEPTEFLGRIAARWNDLEGASRTRGIAHDVVLLHITMTSNLASAIGWTIASITLDPAAAEAARRGDPVAIDESIAAAVRLGQRSVMMRTALRPVVVYDGVETFEVKPGVVVATMLPVAGSNADGGDPGSDDRSDSALFGERSFPVRGHWTPAIALVVRRVFGTFEVRSEHPSVPDAAPHHFGDIARPTTGWTAEFRLI